MSIFNPLTWRRKSYEYDEEGTVSYLTEAQTPTDEQYLESPWLAMLDMTNSNNLKKARLIRDMENVIGQTFQIKRGAAPVVDSTSPGASSGHVVLQLDHVPDVTELHELLLGQFGGGSYNLYAKSKPNTLLLSYKLPGEPKYPTADDAGSSKRVDPEDFELSMSRDAFSAMKNSNPKGYEYMTMMILAKRLGIKPDMAMLNPGDSDDSGDKDWEEKLLRERLEDDEEFKELYTKSAMEAKFGKQKSGSPLDAIIKMRESMVKLGTLPDGGSSSGSGGGDMMGMIGGIVKDALIAAQNPALAQNLAAARATPPPPAQDAPVQNPTYNAATPVLSPPVTAPTQTPQVEQAEQPVVSDMGAPVQVNQGMGAQTVAPAAPETNNVAPQAALQMPAEWLVIIQSEQFESLANQIDVTDQENAPKFMQGLYVTNEEVEDKAVEAFIALLRDNDPQALHASIRNDLLTVMEMTHKGLISAMVGPAKYESAVSLVRNLSSSNGLSWLMAAHATAMFLEGEIRTAEEKAPIQLSELQDANF